MKAAQRISSIIDLGAQSVPSATRSPIDHRAELDKGLRGKGL
jgi:hypothetical protein